VTTVVVGVGLSSGATAEEVATLVTEVLHDLHLTLDDVSALATRQPLAADPRLRLGPPVLGVPDDDLVAASPPVEREVGLPARVAETAARLVSGGPMLAPTSRGVHVTVAVAVSGGTLDPGE
jgi:cobalamin biosynthesis protein CbiG